MKANCNSTRSSLRETSFARSLRGAFPKRDGLCAGGIRGYPPPPLVYWSHRVSAKLRKNLWGAITCGQNLDVKELRSRTLRNRVPKRDDERSAHRLGLDDDRASEVVRARSDVTPEMWKTQDGVFSTVQSKSKSPTRRTRHHRPGAGCHLCAAHAKLPHLSRCLCSKRGHHGRCYQTTFLTRSSAFLSSLTRTGPYRPAA